MSGPVLKRELQKDGTQIGEHRCWLQKFYRKRISLLLEFCHTKRASLVCHLLFVHLKFHQQVLHQQLQNGKEMKK